MPLKEPKNYREITPRCCVTCKHFKEVQVDVSSNTGVPIFEAACERSEDYLADGEDNYYRICDYYKE